MTDGWGALMHSKSVDELSRAPEDVLSFVDVAGEVSVWY